MKRDPWSLIVDENGKFSMARTGLALTLLVTLRVVWADTFGRGVLSELGAALLTTVIITLSAWAAGPRFAAAALPQLSATISALRRGLQRANTPDAAPPSPPPAEDEKGVVG